MSAQARNLLMIVAGAAIGGAAGYLFLTEDGRRLRARMEPALGDLVQDVRRLGAAVASAGLLVRDGLQAMNQLTGDAERSAAWPGPVGQRYPF